VKNSHRLLALAVLFLCFIGANGSVLAQSSVLETNRKLLSHGPPAPPPGAEKSRGLSIEATASIAFDSGRSVTALCHQGGFDRVGLRHDQTVDIAVQYSTAVAGTPITVVPLDGGAVVASRKDLIVGADGTIRFKFRAGHQPGVYQIALHNGNQELGLQFWVLDEEHPANNPAGINPGN
jgi:hypothetical protein